MVKNVEKFMEWSVEIFGVQLVGGRKHVRGFQIDL